MVPTLAIIVFASLSYIAGLRAVLEGKYRPSIYSRFIWFLLAVNSFLGVAALHNRSGSISLAGIQALGAIVILAASLKYSKRIFGLTEKICSILLIISAIVWVAGNSPLTNLALGLSAHFIGGIPTIKRAWRMPASENLLFWLFFAVASVIALTTADKSHVSNFLYALYFVFFDSMLMLLAARKYQRLRWF